jgi:hypothetical protein
MPDKPLRYALLLFILTIGASCRKQVLVEYITTPARRVVLTADPTQPGLRIPADFTGLSFEKDILPQSLYLSTGNTALVKMVKLLGAGGVLRIGGNSVEKVFWAGHARNGSTDVDSMYTDDVVHFFDFVKATGWKTIYGVNLAQSTDTRSAEEASYALSKGGASLEAFEIGNEPDLYASNGLKATNYTYSDFQVDWLTYYTAIQTAAGDAAPVAGPATADKLTWLLPFIAAEYKRLTLATHHYYRMGPPSNASVTIQELLTPDPQLMNDVTQAIAAARSAGIPFRIGECNSVYDGGKKGVSNTMASALWGLDYMYTVASMGVEGVNFHGGTGGYYSPILLSKTGPVAEPLLYGMLCFQLGCQGRFIPLTLTNAVNLTAYAVLADDGTLNVTVINKDPSYNADVVVHTGATLTSSACTALSAAAATLTATGNITLGGAAVKADGSFTGAIFKSIPHAGDSIRISVPVASAMVISIK